jgi:hypothetical protein
LAAIYECKKPRQLVRSNRFLAAFLVASSVTNERFAARDGAQKPKDKIMSRQTMNRAVVIAITGAIALGATTASWAAPVLSNTRAVKESAPSVVVSDVRYYRGYRGYHAYRGHYYRGNGPGVALGVLGVAGAVAGAAAYGNGYYGSPGYYRQGYYGGGPYYGY